MKYHLKLIGAAVLAACLMVMGTGVPAMASDNAIIDSQGITIIDDSVGLGAGDMLEVDVIDVFDYSAGFTLDKNALDLKSPITLVAVDNSISTLCRPGAPESYSRPGGFCAAVASYGSQAVKGGGGGCPAGFEPNPAPPPKCIPEV